MLDATSDGRWLGRSEMAHRVRAFDWSHTPIGPIERWPTSLRVAMGMCLHSRFAMAVYWGPDLNHLYNDAHRHVLGELHPGALALPARVHLEGDREVLMRLRSVVATGEATWTQDEPLVFDHGGTPEIRYSTYSYSPIPDDDGGVGGVLLVVQDTTERVNSHRRADLLARLAAGWIGAVSEGELCLRAAEELEGSLDVPLSVTYLAEPDGASVSCAAVSGKTGGAWAPRQLIPMDDPGDEAAAILRDVTGVSSTGRLACLGPFLARAAPPASPERAWVTPIRRAPGEPPAGFVVAGVNGRLAFDTPYRAFLELVAGQLSRAVGAAQARDAEGRAVRGPELHTLLDELRAAQRRVAAAGDAERRRIEHDLHDGAQQRLVALQLEMGLLDEQIDSDRRAAHEQLGRLRHALEEALAELRELAHGVYPPLLASDGLVEAVAAAARRAPMPVSVTAEDVGTLPGGVAAAAYFCCLEALQNVAKHAGAGARAAVRIEVDDGALRFRVQDDGTGFDPGAVAAGYGLVNLRDRLAALGGTAEVSSTPGHGTSVEGCLPLD